MLLSESLNYGVGDAVVVVDSVVVDVDASGVAVVIGVDSAGLLVVVVVLSELLDEPGEGFTIVVLFSVFSGEGEVVVVVVSDFCSHATKSAAVARMQMYFFIIVRIDWPQWAKG